MASFVFFNLRICPVKEKKHEELHLVKVQLGLQRMEYCTGVLCIVLCLVLQYVQIWGNTVNSSNMGFRQVENDQNECPQWSSFRYQNDVVRLHQCLAQCSFFWNCLVRGGKWGVWPDSLKLWLQQSHRFWESCVMAPVEHDPQSKHTHTHS